MSEGFGASPDFKTFSMSCPSCIRCGGQVVGDNFICDGCRDGNENDYEPNPDFDHEAIINIEQPINA